MAKIDAMSKYCGPDRSGKAWEECRIACDPNDRRWEGGHTPAWNSALCSGTCVGATENCELNYKGDFGQIWSRASFPGKCSADTPEGECIHVNSGAVYGCSLPDQVFLPLSTSY